MTGPLRALWSTPPASPPPPRRVWRDWVLLGVFVPLPVVEAVLRPELPVVLVWAVVLAALAPSLLFRRTYPLTSFAIPFLVVGVLTVATGAGPELYSSAYLALLPFSVLRWGSGRSATVAVGLVVINLVVAAWIAGSTVSAVVGSVAVTIAIVALALALRYRATARLRERDRIALLERESLARDLHDTVAHHVSAIAIRAQAGLAGAPRDPEAATDALRVIEAEASRALSELRTIVRALRTDNDGDVPMQPLTTELDRLAAGPGIPVEVTTRGDTSSLSPALAAAVYRIAQEAVTNARRHSDGATRITVDLNAGPDQVSLRVHDDGSLRGSSEPGFGIAGMTERASLLGGSLEAGPGDNGWTVAADLPRERRR